MPVDVQIAEVTTRVSATDPELLNDPKFIRRLVTLVKEELARETEVDRRRDADRQGLRGAGGGR